MKTWFHTHPFIACFLAAALTFFATAYFALISHGDPLSVWDVLAFVLVAFGALLMVQSTRKGVVTTLAACVFLSSSARAEEEFKPAALWVGGAIVVGIGVWVGYKIITCGRRIAATRTNLAPEELNFVVARAADEYAAAFFWPSTECYQERRSGTNEVEQVPLSFDRVTHTVTTGAGGIAVTVERSDDVAGPWHPLARFNVGAGSEIEIRDASIERQFYRVTTGAIPD